MMNTVEIKPFSENALRRIAQIIVRKYRRDEDDGIASGANIYDVLFPGRRSTRNFFGRAGYLKDFIDSEEVLNSTFWSLAKIQTHSNGRDKLIKIIEQLCDPEEYFNDPENREVVIAQINEVLSRYNLKVSENGNVLTSPLMIILDNTAAMLKNLSGRTAEGDEEQSSCFDKPAHHQHIQQKVFVCYSHKDVRWLKQLQVHLKPLERCGIIELWNDTKILPGAISREEIENALEAATIAVTLVSPDFLASDFISEYELPTLLSRAKTGGTRILSVILSHCLFDKSGLEIFQTVNPPTKPLSEMTKGERDKVWVSLAKAIQASLEQGKP